MKLIFAAGLLVTALLAIHVTPTQCTPVPEAEPEPTALAEADPTKCSGGKGGGGGNGGDGGALLDLELLLSIDLSGLGDLLNALLGLLVGIAKADRCDYKNHALKLQGLLVQLEVYVSVLGIDIQVNLLILLGPLLDAVLGLVEGLLSGVLVDLSIVLNLVLSLLVTLNLEIDLDVALQLGNLLNLDVLALISLG